MSVDATTRKPQQIAFAVYGEAEPQGSTRAFVVGGRARITSTNKRLKPWRAMVQEACRETQLILGDWPTLSREPIDITIDFGFVRPASVSPKRRPHPSVKPDLDKLVRAILDSLTAVLWADDAQVCAVHAHKQYVVDGQPAKTFVIVREIAPGATETQTQTTAAQ